MDKNRILFVFTALIILAGLFFILPREDAREENPNLPEITTIAIDPFKEIKLEAKAVYVFDINSGNVLFEKESGLRLPLASLSKAMTALVAYEVLPEAEGFIIPITGADIQKDGDDNLLVGEKWRFADLIDFVVVKSSNDGAAAIASTISSFYFGGGTKAFVQKMNEKAIELDMQDTFFLNETGLDIESYLAGGYGTAEDIAKLFAYIVKRYPDALNATRYYEADLTPINAPTHTIKNTNPLVASVSGIIASKTGFTDLAGGNLVVVFDASYMRPVVAVVLGSSYEGRFSDMRQLIEATILKL